MFRAALSMCLLVLSACTLPLNYDVEVQTLLVDEVGAPVMEQEYQMCGGALFGEDTNVAATCQTAVTDRQGLGTASFRFREVEALNDVQLSITVDGTEFEGEVLTFDQAPHPEFEERVDASVTAKYTAPRAILPQKLTRFELSGTVSGGRDDGIFDQTGTITARVSFDGGETVQFAGTAPITTDSAALYRADVEVFANFDFPTADEYLTFTIDIDGYQGQNLDFAQAEQTSDEPRVIRAFMSF
ncbi:MAG: hypothetical protein AB8H79_07065 [Myxococcota bacterium]